MPHFSVVVRQTLFKLFVTVLILPGFAIASKPITILSYTDYPPYLFHENGEQTGLYMRIVRLTLEAIDQPFTVETFPFKRALVNAAAGEGVVIGVLKTEERSETLDFSEPIYQERVTVFFNQPQAPLLSSVDQLSGLTIGKLLGWSYGKNFDQAMADNRFATQNGELKSNFSMVANGRLDAVIHTELSSLYILNKLELNEKVYLGSVPLELVDIRIAVQKGTHQELLDQFNAKLREPDHLVKINELILSYTQ